MRKFQLDSVGYSTRYKKWFFHTGRQKDNFFIYFKNKKEADKFNRYASKFTQTMFIQSNLVFTEVFSMYRNLYFQFDFHSDEHRFITKSFENINFQFDRWTHRKYFSGDGSISIFQAPSKIQNYLLDVLLILRSFAKKTSNTPLVYSIDSKITYLSFLKSQFAEFDSISQNDSDYTKIIRLPIMKIVAI